MSDLPAIGSTVKFRRPESGEVVTAKVTGYQKPPGTGVHLQLDGGGSHYGVRKSEGGEPGWLV